ncbi:MAG: lipopolysaccharide transport periplasmic protein LptA [Thermodesulfobacteriota bacterium]
MPLSRLIVAACCWLAALAAPCLAAPSAGDQPINIEADRMVSQQKDNAVFFAGNVTATQGEMSIRADEMTVHYHPQPDKGDQAEGVGGGKLKKLSAKGNVQVRSSAWTATGNAMDYLAAERKVLLNGNAKVWQDNNVVSGESMVLYLDEGKSIVERSPRKGERVKAFFYPTGEESGARR